MEATSLQFTDHPSLKGREDRYAMMRVETAAILGSWRKSLFAFEWLNPDGSLRSMDELPLHERDKRLKAEKLIAQGQPLERPVLGIGLLDNVEIGAGRDIFMTLAAHGLKEIEVHVPLSAKADFKPFLSR